MTSKRVRRWSSSLRARRRSSWRARAASRASTARASAATSAATCSRAWAAAATSSPFSIASQATCRARAASPLSRAASASSTSLRTSAGSAIAPWTKGRWARPRAERARSSAWRASPSRPSPSPTRRIRGAAISRASRQARSPLWSWGTRTRRSTPSAMSALGVAGAGPSPDCGVGAPSAMRASARRASSRERRAASSRRGAPGLPGFTRRTTSSASRSAFSTWARATTRRRRRPLRVAGASTNPVERVLDAAQVDEEPVPGGRALLLAPHHANAGQLGLGGGPAARVASVAAGRSRSR